MLKRHDTIESEDFVFSFGKHQGKSIREVLDTNPQYIVFLYEKHGWDFHWEILEQAETLPERP